MKFRLMATTLAVALLGYPAMANSAGQDTLIVAQADGTTQDMLDQIMADSRPASELTDKELNARLALIRKVINAKDLSQSQRQQVRKLAQDARQEALKRRQAANQEKKQNAGDTDGTEQSAASSTSSAEEAQKLEAEAQKFLADSAGFKEMSVSEIRTQMKTGRSLIQNTATPKSLMPKLRERQNQLRDALQAADAAQKQADQSAAGDSSGQTAQQKPAPDAAAIEAEAQAFLAETQDLKSMSEPDLRKKLKQGRGLIDNPATPKALMPKLRQRQAQLRDALQTAAKNKDNQPAAGGQPTTDQQQTTQKPPGENQQKAEKILADDRAATALSDDQLRERLDATRELLAASDLQRTTVKQLRLKLARDRAEYRRRVADAEAGKRPGSGQGNAGRTPELQSDDFYLKDTRRAVTLSTPELERRALVLRIAIVDTRYSAAERAAWRSLLETDRTELRRRALEDRRRREAEWRKRRDDGDLDISININIRPEDDGFGRPRPIYLAEADDDEIEQYLVAAPVRPPARRYTIDEVVRDPVVRQTMPAVEIDTIKFGFNEDFVREEALEDLDRVGEVLEKIVAAHPKEVFLVEGHTDAVGSDAYNLDLSRRRAESVKQALTTYYNIEPRNLATVGYGERYLRIQTDEAEEENRRVTIRRATPLVGELN